MPRYDDRAGPTRLYVGRLSTRTRSRDLEDLFSKYGRVREVDVKHDFAFVEFSDPRDADDARHYLNGKDFEGNRIVVEFARRGPRGSGGTREYLGRGPPPGTGRCYNCGNDGHWARDCKAGDWRDKCYRCGQRGHIERNCRNSPRASNRSRSRSRSGGHKRSRSRSLSRSGTYSRSPRRRYSRSPVRGRSRSPVRGRSRSPVRDRRRSRSRSLSTGPGHKDHRKDSRSRSRSPVRSPGSPVRSPGSPVRSLVRSPVRTPVRSPVGNGRSMSNSPPNHADSQSPRVPKKDSPRPDGEDA